VVTLAFQLNSAVVASADEGHSLRFWDAEKGVLLSAHTPVRPPPGGTEDAAPPTKDTQSRREIHLAFSPDGRRLAVGADRAVQVWDAAARRLLLVLELAENGLNHHLSFSADGTQLLVANGRTVGVWDSVPTTTPLRPDSLAAERVPEYDRRSRAAGLSRDWYTVEYYADVMVRLKPDSSFWLARRGMARLIRGKAAEAEADHRQALILAAASERRKAAELSTVWNQRGEALVYTGRWAEAEEAHRESTRLTPAAGYCWQNLGECRLARGDTAGYFECCGEMLKGYNPSKPLQGLGVSTFSLASVPQEEHRAKLLEMAKLPASAFTDRERVYAALLYRAGNYRESLTQCWNTQASGFRLRAWDMLFRAMAHHQLKQPDDAREWLGKARDWIAEADRVAATPTAWSDFRWSEWNEEVQVRALLKEAETLIGGLKGTGEK